MSWFTDLISGGVDKVVDSVGNAIDKLVTSDEERLALKNELVKVKLEAAERARAMELEAEAKIDEEVTKRWQADQSGDEPLAKKVRPFSLLYLLAFMSFIIVTDSTEYLAFDVKEGYVQLIESLLLTVFIAYFGSRGIEKAIALRKK